MGSIASNYGIHFVWEDGGGLRISIKTSYKEKLDNWPLAVDVEVTTSDGVAFSQDYGVRLFVYVDDTWVEIENAMNYAESLPESEILPIEGGIFKTGTAIFIPYYRDLKKPTRLRIVLVGNLVQEGTISEDKTAGYVDGILNP